MSFEDEHLIFEIVNKSQFTPSPPHKKYRPGHGGKEYAYSLASLFLNGLLTLLKVALQIIERHI